MALLPRIEQLIVSAPAPSEWDEETFERRLFLARKSMSERAPISRASLIPSASCRTVVYKGLFTASKIDQFYWDLTNPRFETYYAIFNQRYSTYTFPSWSIAQPFRSVAHNGEINTIRSNRAWMVGRQVSRQSTSMGRAHWRASPFSPARAIGLGKLGQCL